MEGESKSRQPQSSRVQLERDLSASALRCYTAIYSTLIKPMRRSHLTNVQDKSAQEAVKTQMEDSVVEYRLDKGLGCIVVRPKSCEIQVNHVSRMPVHYEKLVADITSKCKDAGIQPLQLHFDLTRLRTTLLFDTSGARFDFPPSVSDEAAREHFSSTEKTVRNKHVPKGIKVAFREGAAIGFTTKERRLNERAWKEDSKSAYTTDIDKVLAALLGEGSSGEEARGAADQTAVVEYKSSSSSVTSTGSQGRSRSWLGAFIPGALKSIQSALTSVLPFSSGTGAPSRIEIKKESSTRLDRDEQLKREIQLMEKNGLMDLLAALSYLNGPKTPREIDISVTCNGNDQYIICIRGYVGLSALELERLRKRFEKPLGVTQWATFVDCFRHTLEFCLQMRRSHESVRVVV